MIEISRTTHSYITLDEDEVREAIQLFLHQAKEINIPDEALVCIVLSPEGAIVEYTEHEGPAEEPDQD